MGSNIKKSLANLQKSSHISFMINNSNVGDITSTISVVTTILLVENYYDGNKNNNYFAENSKP